MASVVRKVMRSCFGFGLISLGFVGLVVVEEDVYPKYSERRDERFMACGSRSMFVI